MRLFLKKKKDNPLYYFHFDHATFLFSYVYGRR